MTVFDFACRKCGARVEDSPRDMTSEPCKNPTCEGVLKKVYSFYLAPVRGAGGSPGKRAGGHA